MQANLRSTALAAAASSLALAVCAPAQELSLDPLANQLDLRAAPEFGTPNAAEAARTFLKDGAAPERPYRFELDFATGHDTNAFNDGSELDDWGAGASAKALAELPLGELMLKPRAEIGFQRWETFSQLDSEFLGVGAELTGFAGKALPLSVVYASGWGFSDGFDEVALATHELGLRATQTFELGAATAAQVAAGAAHGWADPSDHDAFTFSVEAGLAHALADRLTLKTGAGLAFRSYDDFGGIDRDFWRAQASLGLEYSLGGAATFRAGVGYLHHADDLEGFDFDKLTPGLGLKLEF